MNELIVYVVVTTCWAFAQDKTIISYEVFSSSSHAVERIKPDGGTLGVNCKERLYKAELKEIETP